jgi:hypothetical protein
MIAAVAHQRRASIQIEAARTWLGTLWPIVHEAVLCGLDISAWAEANRMDRKAAPGYLAAALDRLVQFYEERTRPRQQQLRVVQVRSPAVADA